MALNLFDYLTPLDNKRIENYVKTWGCQDYVGNEVYLEDWNKDKKRLFHLLGGNLILSKDYKIEMNEDALNHSLVKMLNDCLFFDELDDFLFQIYKSKSQVNDFYDTQAVFFRNTVDSLRDNKLRRPVFIDVLTNRKPLKMQAGTGFLKALRKMLEYFDAPPHIKGLFEKMRLDHSRIMNNRVLEGELCVSIHPLDFMTMSDNDSNWSSCMSWQDYGCYHNGTVEMMNSNMVICAYLKSKSSFNFSEEKKKSGEEWEWNNKKWRQLFYCTKDIILGGKAYPYKCEEMTKDIITWLRELALENWNRTYRYGIESYKDMRHINNLNRMEWNKTWISRKHTTKHNIIFDTRAMYNDMLNDHRYNYLCVRNKVKKNTILNVSGKSRCVCCGDHNVVELIDYDNLWYGDYSVEDGEPDISDDDAFDYNARYAGTKKVMCTSCYRDHYCWYCGEDSHRFRTITIEDSDGYERKICEKCYTEKYKKCPTCGNPFYAYNKYTLGFIPNSCIFGLYQDEYDPELDYEHDISTVLKTREPIKDRVMIFNECPECTKERMEHSSRIEIPYDQKLVGKESFKNFTKKIYINNELVKDKEVGKYHYSNLVGFSKDDFYKIYKKS